jgi:hypothetical protein
VFDHVITGRIFSSFFCLPSKLSKSKGIKHLLRRNTPKPLNSTPTQSIWRKTISHFLENVQILIVLPGNPILQK